ncbi:hypothetical protein EVAR_80410_1 [Eumeta japonica]|uniref:Uncharacterized protein n=1 Tax=Eumeta variegata TaxID=151549 RepID=A0A4C1VIL4_EUMVA|nr:hypothetical protein EVAR_80410_1 [Eumeta japonica]
MLDCGCASVRRCTAIARYEVFRNSTKISSDINRQSVMYLRPEIKITSDSRSIRRTGEVELLSQVAHNCGRPIWRKATEHSAPSEEYRAAATDAADRLLNSWPVTDRQVDGIT